MPKMMVFDQDARSALGRGVALLTRAVQSTLGPKGGNAVIDVPIGTPIISRDGVSIAAEIEGGERSDNAKEGDQQSNGDEDVRKPVQPAMTVAEVDEEVFGSGRVLKNLGRWIDDSLAVFFPSSAKGQRLGIFRLHHLRIDVIEAAREFEPCFIDIRSAATSYFI